MSSKDERGGAATSLVGVEQLRGLNERLQGSLAAGASGLASHFPSALAQLESLPQMEDGLLAAPNDANTAVLLSLVEERNARAAFEEVVFDTHDPGWVFKFTAEWLAGRFHKRPFIEPDEHVAALPNDAAIAILGDWGTGRYGAPECAATITKTTPRYQALVHLGDVYYAGTANEVRERFLAFWPNVPGASSWAANSNHEMYSGGEGYFDVTLKDPRFAQTGSCFAFQNDSFLFLGLDTAYEDHKLHGTQATWVAKRIAHAGARKVVLLSHHQPFSHFESGGEHLLEALAPVLEKQRVFAWYWGHEHRCKIFDRHPRYGFYGRCIGHSGYPAFRDKFHENPMHVNDDGSLWRRVARNPDVPGADVLDGINMFVPEHRDRYAPNGFLSLHLAGDKLTETVRSPTGLVLYQKTLD
ncbi:MAG: metallophosphoesterase [Polyangiaceae bacterium]